jgi:hypothetical protein
MSPCDTCDYNGGFRPGIHVWEPGIKGTRDELMAELATYQSTPLSLDLNYIPLSMGGKRREARP